MMEVYIANILPLSENGVFEQRLHLLPEERKEHIIKCKRTADRLRGLGAGLLLEYGLRQRGYSLVGAQTGNAPVALGKGKHGKPYLRECPGLFFNLSHAGDYVAAIFAENEVGVDIERIRSAWEGVARRFFLPEECAYLGLTERGVEQMAEDSVEQLIQEERDLRFARLWTRKESYIKAVGEGMHLSLDTFSVLGDEVTRETLDGNNVWYLQSHDVPEGYVLSTCSREKRKVELKEINLREIL